MLSLLVVLGLHEIDSIADLQLPLIYPLPRVVLTV
jgi:hypothetical protein